MLSYNSRIGSAPTLNVSDCPAVTNTCNNLPGEIGTCSYTGLTCSDESPCTPLTANCSTKSCHCQNPDYNPSDPICTAQECDDICLLRCDEESQLCLQDTSCELDSDCTAGGRNICSNDGRCVECTKNSECDEENDESCVEGTCKKPCEVNEECPLFNECDGGECKYVGCHSDRECILAASRGNDDGETPTGGHPADERRQPLGLGGTAHQRPVTGRSARLVPAGRGFDEAHRSITRRLC